MSGFSFASAPQGPQSVFGAAAPSQSQGSLFGTAGSQPSLFSTPSAQSNPSLFGAAPQSQSGLFGSAPQSQAGLFGAAQQTQSSLFGGTPQSQSSIFGGAPQAQSSVFGATPQTQSSVFGATQQSQPSLFGATPQSQSSVFGGPQPQSSLFGAPQSQSGLFGSTQQSQSSLFGGSSQAQPKPSLFGAPQSQSSPFGIAQSQPSLFGAGPSAPPNPPAKMPGVLSGLIDKLNPAHPQSQFHTVLYNKVPPEQIARFTKPPGMSEVTYNDACAKNPDPSRLVPVQANLFDDLITRADMQNQRVNEHKAVLKLINETLVSIERSVESDIEPKLAAYRRRHRELARKLLRIASKVELAISKNDGSVALSTSEIERKRRLESLARALTAPAEFRDKLFDLAELSESAVLERKEAAMGELRDPRAAAAVKSLLTEQLSGIQHLSDVCNRARRDVQIMTDGLSE